MELTFAVLCALFTSLWICGLTIRAARVLKFGVDESTGVQKSHSHWVPRLGGVPIFVAFLAGILLLAWQSGLYVRETAFVIICLLPAFGIGLVEDVTRRAGILVRLAFTMVAAALGWWLLGAGLFRLDLPVVDQWLAGSATFAFIMTLVAAAGLAHAVNIIDGCNGLSSFVSGVVLASLGCVGMMVGDELVARIAFLAVAALAGFFAWNFPFGRIFLGDAGAYMIGFLIAELSMLLVARNPEVSAWFPMLLMIYPVWETLFSMGRRARYGLRQMGLPDALHLHQLILRRLVRLFSGSWNPTHRILRNSIASTYLWLLAVLCAVPAILFHKNSQVLFAACVLFVMLYLWLYRSLVNFRAPSFMLLTREPRKEYLPKQ
jgi:UDP-GlcNAc:undecaprenyl-phosphate GlcNAc-1-phosphate transferase